MIDLKIKVKDVKEFVKEQRVMYASVAGKRFFVALHAGPRVERYIVQTKDGEQGFTNVGEAVRHFNASQ